MVAKSGGGGQGDASRRSPAKAEVQRHERHGSQGPHPRLRGSRNGQLRYSLDGGPEQPSPRFTGVAPGRHTVLIRDAGLAGCDSTVQVTVLGPAGPAAAPTGPSQGVDFVGQPLWYPLTGQPAGALVELELWAESAHGQENFTQALKMRKRADAQGDVAFRLDTLLWPLLSAFVPPAALNVASRLCTTNLVNYFVRTTTTPTDPLQPVTTGASPLRTALRGALPAEWQGVDYFAYRQNLPFTHPPCLSWQPLGPGTRAAGQPKPVTPAQPEWLFFLCPLANTTDDLRVRRAYSTTVTGTPVVDYEPLARPLARGWAQRLLAIPLQATRTGFAYLSVRVETTAGVPVSQDAVYQFVEEGPRTRYLLFTNSLGTVDTVRCSDKARLEITLEATTEKVERPARPGDVAVTADRQVSDLTASRKLKFAVGWLLPAELAWLQDLVLSREVWHLADGQLRPLDVAKRSLATYTDEPTLRGLLLECDYAYSPIAYAPPYDA